MAGYGLPAGAGGDLGQGTSLLSGVTLREELCWEPSTANFLQLGMSTSILMGGRSWWYTLASAAGVSLGLEQCLACGDDGDNSYPLWGARPCLKYFMYIFILFIFAIIPCGRHYYYPFYRWGKLKPSEVM